MKLYQKPVCVLNVQTVECIAAVDFLLFIYNYCLSLLSLLLLLLVVSKSLLVFIIIFIIIVTDFILIKFQCDPSWKMGLLTN